MVNSSIVKNKVIILGAGVAGMTAAMHLIKAGFSVDIYESSSKIGGRCFSFTSKNFGKLVLDNGQHIFAGAYKNFFELLDWLGTKNKLIPQKALLAKFIKINSSNDSLYYDFDCFNLPSKLGLLSAVKNLYPLTLSEKIKLSYVIVAANKKTAANKKNTKKKIYNDEPVIDFLRRKKQSDNTITHFWEPIVLATLNAPIKEASTNLFLNVLKLLLLGDNSNNKLVFTEAAFRQLFAKFQELLLENNSNIYFNSSVKTILTNNHNKCLGIELANKKKLASYVISTLPPAKLAKITTKNIYDSNAPNNSSINLDYLSSFNYSAIISIYLLFDKIVSQENFLGSIGTNIQWINCKSIKISNKSEAIKIPNTINTINETNDSKQQLISLTISAANELMQSYSNNKLGLLEIILDELKKIFPETKNANLLAHKIICDKKATVLISSKNSMLRPNPKTYINNFYLAGDWTNTHLPATIESASLSGKLAAAEVYL